jgi:hypothetical protein
MVVEALFALALACPNEVPRAACSMATAVSGQWTLAGPANNQNSMAVCQAMLVGLRKSLTPTVDPKDGYLITECVTRNLELYTAS